MKAERIELIKHLISRNIGIYYDLDSEKVNGFEIVITKREAIEYLKLKTQLKEERELSYWYYCNSFTNEGIDRETIAIR